MKKLWILIPVLIVAAVFFFSKKSPTVVGVIVPMEHEALSQIVKGLKEALPSASIKVMNAQGDANLQRAVIEQYIRDRCDLLVPIGTTASQMTLNLAKEQPILCLAADPAILTDATREHATGLNDELSARDSLAFLHTAFPQIKKITLIYSCSEKVAKEIPVVMQAATQEGIEVQKLMIQNLSELYTMSCSIAQDSGAIFILKDHLIVSGIQTVATQAGLRGIPVMASDEGSVISGAAFAIGVKEASIGQQGAQIARAILNGTSPKDLSPQTMQGPFPLFINRAACLKQGIDLKALVQHAEQAGFSIQYTEETKPCS